MKKDVITISREFGSGGKTVGKLVAEKLGIEFYDRDIIKRIVKETGFKQKYVEEYGEYAPSSDHRFAYSFMGLDEEAPSPLLMLWKAEKKVITEFAKQGSCVIVGSCADYILKDMDNCLKVFLYADEAIKEKRIQELYGEIGLKAKNRVQDRERRRSINYQFFTGQQWGKAQNFDMALNSGRLGFETCANLIVEASIKE